MSNLEVRFGAMAHGWLQVDIYAPPDPVSFKGSYIYPSLTELTSALRFLLVGPAGEKVVTWTEEPTEYDLRFRKEHGGEICLDVQTFPDDRRVRETGTPRLSVTGDYDAVCMPFYRALRHLLARYPLDEWRERWTNEAPHDKMDKLKALLKRRRPSF